MDPTANYAEQLRLAPQLIDTEDPPALIQQRTERLAELVIALNHWLQNGGFPPAQWHAAAEANVARVVRRRGAPLTTALETVTTTAGERFTGAESAQLAALIYKRFGLELEAAAAWRRLLGNNCSDSAFLKLAAFAPLHVCTPDCCGCLDAPEQAANDCECNGVGWIHMGDSMGRGPGIERCDLCRKFKTDNDAAEQHAKDCDCGLGVVTDKDGTGPG